MTRFLILLSLALLFPHSAPAQEKDELALELKKVMDRPEYKGASWGMLVVHADTGKVIYQMNADKLFIPASTTKLYSCAAAMIEYGPDHRFKTPVYAVGEVKDGVLGGDLILVASGDLTFGSRVGKDGKTAFANNDHTYANSGLSEAEVTDTNPLAALESLAKQVADSGIKEVRGEILIDERLFRRSSSSGSGPAVVSSILVNDNVVDLLITPGDKAGDAAKVTMSPKTAAVTLDAEVQTAEKGKPATIELDSTGPGQIVVRGRIPVGGKPLSRIYPVEDPALFARALFVEALRAKGIRLTASVFRPTRADVPPGDELRALKPVAVWTSEPFIETLTVTLKVSHNLYASTLPMLLAARTGGQTVEDGLKVQAKILEKLGVPPKEISFGGGAGGSNADMISPQATIALLAAMRKRSDGEQFFNALPRMGIDGTLASTVRADSPIRDRVRAKTGTLIWTDNLNARGMLRSKALAGTMETAKKTPLLFAMFVNNVPLPANVPTSREGKMLGELCEILYRNGP